MKFPKKASLDYIKKVSNPNIVIMLPTIATKMTVKCSAPFKVKNKYHCRVIAGYIWFKSQVSQYKVQSTKFQPKKLKQL
jgi:hypothetical protein